MSTDGYEFEVLRIYDTLQRVARNPDYERLCQNLVFDEKGFAEIDTLAFSIDTDCLSDRERGTSLKALQEKTDQQEEALKAIQEKFGLIQPIQPSVILEDKYSTEFFSQIPIFQKDPFACMLVFHRTTANTLAGGPPFQTFFPGSEDDVVIICSPIHDGHYIVVDIDLLAPVKTVKSSIKEYMSVYRGQLDMGFRARRELTGCLKHNGIDHVRLRIDLLAYEKTPMELIGQLVGLVNNRMRFGERTACYRVWDERKACEESYKEKLMTMELRTRRDFIWKTVAQKLSIDEDTARKRYARAHYLITDERYTANQWREEKTNFLLKKARSLPAKEAEKDWEKILQLEGMPEKLPYIPRGRTDPMEF